MNWTLTYGEVTQTFEEWGLSGLAIELKNFDVGTASFSHPGALYDGTALFEHDESAIIKAGEVIVFQGKFAAPKRSGRGADEVIHYVLRDAWWVLSRTPYPPNLFGGGIGKLFSSLSIGGMYENVIGVAAGAGVAVQFGSAANLAAAPLEMEIRDGYCDGVLSSLRKWCPDVNHRMDYSTTPPTIHFIRRADAEAISQALPNVADGIEIESLEDLLVSKVVLRYVKTNAGESGPETEVVTDAYPSAGFGTGAVVASFDLRGRTIETQTLETNNINSSSRAWWAPKYSWLQPSNADLVEGTGFGFFETDRFMQDVDGNWVADSSGSVYEIKDGAVPQWLSGEARQVLVKATVKDFTLNGHYIAEQELEATVNACSVAGGTYTRETYAGETPPVGLAAQFYAATSVLHYRGKYEWTQDELSLPLPHCCNVLNLTGGSAAARGWTTMRAVIQGVQIDVQNAKVSVSFGPPEKLSPQDLFEFSQMDRNQQPTQALALAGSGGIKRTAGSNSLPPKPSAVPGSGKFVVTGGGGVFHVTTGRVNDVAARANTAGGDVIDGGIDFEFDDGWIYVGINYDFTRAEGYIVGKTGPVIFIAKTIETDLAEVEDKMEGNFAQGLAKIVDGEIAENASWNRNAKCMVAAANIGDAETQSAELAILLV